MTYHAMAFFREVDFFYDENGHKTGEQQYQRGVLSSITWYWATGVLRCRRGMSDLHQEGLEEAWNKAGKLVYKARFHDGQQVELLVGDPLIEERPPQ
jgi:antitoxin component YwqK of YwqJK toxin-antitoxin module